LRMVQIELPRTHNGLAAGFNHACRKVSLRSDALSTLWKCAAIAKQTMVHRNTSATAARKKN
jgi:hypothetical protein